MNMTDLNRISDLAIVGMDVISPGIEGINRFGWLIYRGLLTFKHVSDKPVLINDAVQTVQSVLQQSGLSANQVSLFSLSPIQADAFITGGFKGQMLDLSANPNPVTASLATAEDMLNCGDAEAVLIIETQISSQTVSAAILTLYSFALDNAKPIYAVIAGASEANSPLTDQSVASACQKAIAAARIQPERIELIETTSLINSGINSNEAQALLATYPVNGNLTCALGSGLPGLLGVIKTAWCLYQRIIPCVPDWTGLKPANGWQRSPFYISNVSRTWFLSAGQKQRFAAINILSTEGDFAHIILRDEISTTSRFSDAIRNEVLHLFPIAAKSTENLVEKIKNLQPQILNCSNLVSEAQRIYQQYLIEKESANYSACLMGHTSSELDHEISSAVKGIPAALAKNSDWQTPLGSYFTPQPLGEKGRVAFVYPGAFNSYPGIGRDLFYLFPYLYDRLASFSSQIGNLLNEHLLYPRRKLDFSSIDPNEDEERLIADPLAMLISGISLAVIYTLLMQDIFEVQPVSAFGYSLGEISMLFASRVWTKGDETSAVLRSSHLFRTRLAGPQNAVREYWRLPIKSQNDPQDNLWSNFVLMEFPEKVREVLVSESRVYLTHINTPHQVVIAGDPAGCRRVIDLLKCNALQAPFNYVLHCAAMQSEYNDLVQLHFWPVEIHPGITLYSSASYQPMPIDQQNIANQIATGLCNCLDFPRLIQHVYNDGAWIFIELGAGSNCTRWVDETLKNQPHAAFSINRKSVDDFPSILRLITRLICHRVPGNYDLLYE